VSRAQTPPGDYPAVIPDPPVREARKYRVTGSHAFYDDAGRRHEPGTTFIALLSEEQEALHIESHHIAPAERKES
jgi:hypothetical protein